MKKKIYILGFALLAFLLPVTHALNVVPYSAGAGNAGQEISATSHLPQSKLEHAGLQLLHVPLAKQQLKQFFVHQYWLNEDADLPSYCSAFLQSRDFIYTKESLRHNYPSHNFW